MNQYRVKLAAFFFKYIFITANAASTCFKIF